MDFGLQDTKAQKTMEFRASSGVWRVYWWSQGNSRGQGQTVPPKTSPLRTYPSDWDTINLSKEGFRSRARSTWKSFWADQHLQVSARYSCLIIWWLLLLHIHTIYSNHKSFQWSCCLSISPTCLIQEMSICQVVQIHSIRKQRNSLIFFDRNNKLISCFIMFISCLIKNWHAGH